MTQNQRFMGASDHVTSSSEVFAGHTILMVEDDLLIATATAEMLTSLGASEVSVATTVGAALEFLEANDPTLAFLDANLNRETSVPVAQACVAAEVPIILTTGYAETDTSLAVFPPAPICTKPYSVEKLRTAYHQLVGAKTA